MASDAQARGWGKGWPTDRSADMTTVTATRSGAKWEVHKAVAPILGYIVNEAERRGYLFHRPGQVHDDWGYANRPIAGTRTPSNHSWGLAVDIDATKYPQGQRRSVPPDWLIALFKQWSWDWGGGWKHADPMHFEFDSTPNRAAQLVAMLAASSVEAKPVPVPPGTPAPIPPPVSVPPAVPAEEDDMIVRNTEDGSIWAVSATHMHHLTPDQWKQRSGVEPIAVRDMHPLEVWSLALAGRQVV